MNAFPRPCASMAPVLSVILALALVLLARSDGACLPVAPKDSGPAAILLLPFSYHGPVESSGLPDEIREGLARRMESMGHRVVLISASPPFDTEKLKDMGKSNGARFVILGSVNEIGNTLSVDLRGVDLSHETTPLPFYARGDMRTITPILDSLESGARKFLARDRLVTSVTVQGNRKVDTDAILAAIKTRPGELLDPGVISSDVKAVYKMGSFDDVRADVSEDAAGRSVTFLVREKPAVKAIHVKGAAEIKEEKVREVIELKPYAVITEKALKGNAEKIKALYEEKGYVGTSVAVTTTPVSEHAADVEFAITEGKKVVIKSIEITGNKAFSDGELKDLMETTEKRPFWVPSIRNIMALVKGESAVLKSDALDRDLGRIGAFYHNKGYVDAKVGRPTVRREGAEIFIQIPVEEGDAYGVGKVTFEDKTFDDPQTLLKAMKIQEQKVFSQEVLRQDILKLTDMCADKGYAYCDVSPRMQKDPDQKVVNIAITVDTGPVVTFDRIEIAGNTRTRDKVIRRELRVDELEPFSATGLKKSRDRLKRLGYFEDVNLKTSKGESADTMRLDVEVKEQPTGSFSIGAGYSSVDKLILMGDISQRNFLGRGQTVSLRGILGSTTSRFSLSFLEPYLWDTQVTFGTDIYNWSREYSDYTKDSTGGAVNFGYPLTDELKAFIGARLDNTTLSNISTYASQIIRDSVDIRTTHSLTTGLSYDSRNDFHFPTRGWVNSVTAEYAGGILGGDSAFLKFEGTASYYHRLWKQLVGHARGGLGYVTEGSGGKLPVYERFFLGGIDSVRGFKYGDISPIDPLTGERIGGEYMGYLQLETIFPLIKDMGLNGVVFVDTGNVWGKEAGYDISDLRKTVGGGIRWLSPMGPLRVEWGYNLDKKPGEDSSNWDFRMGGSF